MNPDHTITGSYKANVLRFGYASVLRGVTPEYDALVRKELEDYLTAYNLQTKAEKLNRPTLYLTEESMLFSIHPKTPKTKRDIELERAWNQQTKK